MILRMKHNNFIASGDRRQVGSELSLQSICELRSLIQSLRNGRELSRVYLLIVWRVRFPGKINNPYLTEVMLHKNHPTPITCAHGILQTFSIQQTLRSCNSFRLFIIYVSSQHLQGQLQKQHKNNSISSSSSNSRLMPYCFCPFYTKMRK